MPVQRRRQCVSVPVTFWQKVKAWAVAFILPDEPEEIVQSTVASPTAESKQLSDPAPSTTSSTKELPGAWPKRSTPPTTLDRAATDKAAARPPPVRQSRMKPSKSPLPPNKLLSARKPKAAPCLPRRPGLPVPPSPRRIDQPTASDPRPAEKATIAAAHPKRDPDSATPVEDTQPAPGPTPGPAPRPTTPAPAPAKTVVRPPRKKEAPPPLFVPLRCRPSRLPPRQLFGPRNEYKSTFRNSSSVWMRTLSPSTAPSTPAPQEAPKTQAGPVVSVQPADASSVAVVDAPPTADVESINEHRDASELHAQEYGQTSAGLHTAAEDSTLTTFATVDIEMADSSSSSDVSMADASMLDVESMDVETMHVESTAYAETMDIDVSPKNLHADPVELYQIGTIEPPASALPWLVAGQLWFAGAPAFFQLPTVVDLPAYCDLPTIVNLPTDVVDARTAVVPPILCDPVPAFFTGVDSSRETSSGSAIVDTLMDEAADDERGLVMGAREGDVFPELQMPTVGDDVSEASGRPVMRAPRRAGLTASHPETSTTQAQPSVPSTAAHVAPVASTSQSLLSDVPASTSVPQPVKKPSVTPSTQVAASQANAPSIVTSPPRPAAPLDAGFSTALHSSRPASDDHVRVGLNNADERLSVEGTSSVHTEAKVDGPLAERTLRTEIQVDKVDLGEAKSERVPSSSARKAGGGGASGSRVHGERVGAERGSTSTASTAIEATATGRASKGTRRDATSAGRSSSSKPVDRGPRVIKNGFADGTHDELPMPTRGDVVHNGRPMMRAPRRTTGPAPGPLPDWLRNAPSSSSSSLSSASSS